jgi:methionyl-tRNA formyltransferase
MLLDEGMDTGPVFLTESTPIGEGETAEDLMARLKGMGAALLVETLKQLVAGDITATAQDDTLATYAPILDKRDGCIDWTLSADVIARRVRGLSPWPGTYTTISGKKLSIHRARALEGVGNGAVGSVVECVENAIVVKCGEGTLLIEELQLEGKRRMEAAEFLRGYGVEKISNEVLS